jgi:hypothetical protein
LINNSFKRFNRHNNLNLQNSESCLQCETFPKEKNADLNKELNKARTLMQKQDDEVIIKFLITYSIIYVNNYARLYLKTPPADLSNCAPS